MSVALVMRFHCELLLKKTKAMLYQSLILQSDVFNQLYYTNKMEYFSYKSGCAMWAANVVCKEDWSINFGLKQLCSILLKSFNH